LNNTPILWYNTVIRSGRSQYIQYRGGQSNTTPPISALLSEPAKGSLVLPLNMLIDDTQTIDLKTQYLNGGEICEYEEEN